MFVVTLNKSKLKLCLIICTVIFSVASLSLLFFGLGKNYEFFKKTDSNSYEVGVDDNAARIDFLKSFGWEVSQEPVDVCEIIIPSEFNATYEKYNDIQKSQGLDLSAYKGQTCTHYSYKISNYPSTDANIYADILVLNKKVIAGDICSTEIGGFMHGFKLPDRNVISEQSDVSSKYEVESTTENDTLVLDPQMPNAPVD